MADIGIRKCFLTLKILKYGIMNNILTKRLQFVNKTGSVVPQKHICTDRKSVVGFSFPITPNQPGILSQINSPLSTSVKCSEIKNNDRIHVDGANAGPVWRQVRKYCTGENANNERRIDLMDIPNIVKPTIFKSLKNLFFGFLIKTYHDPTFSISNFIMGAKQAVEHVSLCLSKGDFDALTDLVSPDALQEIRRNIASMSAQQRHNLSVVKEDFYISFVYEIGMMFDEEVKDKHLFAEVRVVMHGFRGFSNQFHMSPMEFSSYVHQHADKYYICNYRFIREFREGYEYDWTINQLNHFYPAKKYA